MKLSKRFQEFVVGHIGDKFFYYNEKRKTIGKEEFLVALANAYNIRSKYAHIKPLMKHLRMSEFSKMLMYLNFNVCTLHIVAYW